MHAMCVGTGGIHGPWQGSACPIIAPLGAGPLADRSVSAVLFRSWVDAPCWTLTSWHDTDRLQIEQQVLRLLHSKAQRL